MDLVKATMTFSDGSTQEFNAAPTMTAPTEVINVTAGESVEVVNTDAPVTPAE